MDALADNGEISDDLLEALGEANGAKAPPVAKLAQPLQVSATKTDSPPTKAPDAAAVKPSASDKVSSAEASEQKKVQEAKPAEAKEKVQSHVETKAAPATALQVKKGEGKSAKKDDSKVDKPKPITKAEQKKPAPRAQQAQKVKRSDLEDLSGFALPIRELLPNGKPVHQVSEKPAARTSSVDESRLVQPRDSGSKQRVEVVHVETGFALVTNPNTQLPMRVLRGQQLPNGATVTGIDSKNGLIHTNRGVYGMN